MSDLTLSFQITALGMGLVFGAIVLLWLMMVLLTALTAEKETPAEESPDSDSAQPASAPATEFKAQAAAIAVALALASSHPLPHPPTAIVSAWQLGMRTSQRSEKGNFRRH